MSVKSFVAAGDVLINPALIAYATVDMDTEGPRLRLGFAGASGAPNGEVVLGGLEARSMLRWLRTNSEFLDSGMHPGASPRGRRPTSVRRVDEEGCRCQVPALAGL
jgi:hypothetical protein